MLLLLAPGYLPGPAARPAFGTRSAAATRAGRLVLEAAGEVPQPPASFPNPALQLQPDQLQSSIEQQQQLVAELQGQLQAVTSELEAAMQESMAANAEVVAATSTAHQAAASAEAAAAAAAAAATDATPDPVMVAADNLGEMVAAMQEQVAAAAAAVSDAVAAMPAQPAVVASAESVGASTVAAPEAVAHVAQAVLSAPIADPASVLAQLVAATQAVAVAIAQAVRVLATVLGSELHNEALPAAAEAAVAAAAAALQTVANIGAALQTHVVPALVTVAQTAGDAATRAAAGLAAELATATTAAVQAALGAAEQVTGDQLVTVATLVAVGALIQLILSAVDRLWQDESETFRARREVEAQRARLVGARGTLAGAAFAGAAQPPGGRGRARGWQPAARPPPVNRNRAAPPGDFFLQKDNPYGADARREARSMEERGMAPGWGMAQGRGGRGLAGRVVPTAPSAAPRRQTSAPGDYFLSRDDKYGADARASRRGETGFGMAPRGQEQPPLRRRPQTALPPGGRGRQGAVPGNYFMNRDEKYGADTRSARRGETFGPGGMGMGPRGQSPFPPSLRGRRPEAAPPPSGLRQLGGTGSTNSRGTAPPGDYFLSRDGRYGAEARAEQRGDTMRGPGGMAPRGQGQPPPRRRPQTALPPGGQRQAPVPGNYFMNRDEKYGADARATRRDAPGMRRPPGSRAPGFFAVEAAKESARRTEQLSRRGLAELTRYGADARRDRRGDGAAWRESRIGVPPGVGLVGAGQGPSW